MKLWDEFIWIVAIPDMIALLVFISRFFADHKLRRSVDEKIHQLFGCCGGGALLIIVIDLWEGHPWFVEIPMAIGSLILVVLFFVYRKRERQQRDDKD